MCSDIPLKVAKVVDYCNDDTARNRLIWIDCEVRFCQLYGSFKIYNLAFAPKQDEFYYDKMYGIVTVGALVEMHVIRRKITITELVT